MGINAAILAETLKELEGTKKMIERIDMKHADWSPHTKSMSIKNLAIHIAVLQSWFGNAFKKEVFDLKTDFVPVEFKSFKQLSEVMENQIKENISFINTVSDDFWEKEFTFKMGDRIILQAPKKVMYRYMIMNHLIHHRGQLSLYLRILDISVPGMYGPSADEK